MYASMYATSLFYRELTTRQKPGKCCKDAIKCNLETQKICDNDRESLATKWSEWSKCIWERIAAFTQQYTDCSRLKYVLQSIIYQSTVQPDLLTYVITKACFVDYIWAHLHKHFTYSDLDKQVCQTDYDDCLVGFKRGFEGQGLRARLCCRKISDSIFWLYYFTPRWLAGAMSSPKKVPKEIYKKKR